MLLSTKLLLIALPTVLLQVFTSVLIPVGAVPVPAPVPTEHSIGHSHAPPRANQHHEVQVRLHPPPHSPPNTPAHVDPTITHRQIIPNNGIHVHGTLPLQPGTQRDAQGHLAPGRLEAHTNHIADRLNANPAHGPAPHGWQVHARHDPAHNHVTFQAVLKEHGTQDRHRIILPGGQLHQSGHATRNPQEHQTTLAALHQGQQQGHHQHGQIVRDAQGDHMSSSLRVPDHIRANGGMTPDQLETHAHYVANHIAGIHHPQNGPIRVAVHHTPGASHVDYTVKSAPGRRLPTHIPIGDQQLAPLLNGDHPTRSFKGMVPKQERTPHQPTIQDHEEYSAAVRHNLVTQHGSSQIAVASMQHPNGRDIMYHTQRNVVKSNNDGDRLHPFVQGHVDNLVGQT